MVWILLAFMIFWDHPNLLTLSSSSYKRRGALMEKVSFWGLTWIRLSFGYCYLGSMSHFVNIDYECYQIYALIILEVEVCGE
jgi:hypothetical protein